MLPSLKRFPWRVGRSASPYHLRQRLYCTNDRKPASEQGQVASWADEEERAQERLRQRTVREVPRIAWGDRFRAFVDSNNHPATYFVVITGALILYDILKPKNYHITSEISPYDTDLYYVRKADGEIARYHLKKSMDLSYMTRKELDEDLHVNGVSTTFHRDGTLVECTLVEGSREGEERKRYPPHHSIEYAKWENKNDEQSGLKYLYMREKANPSPLDPVIEVFEAKSHQPIRGGYFSQKLVNGDQVEARMDSEGVPHGPARITTAAGETILGASYYRGELRNLPDSYLAPYRESIQETEDANSKVEELPTESDPDVVTSTTTEEAAEEELSAPVDSPPEEAKPKQDPVRPTSNRKENKYDLVYV